MVCVCIHLLELLTHSLYQCLVSPCRLHHLHYESMKHIEKTNPTLMMKLYKLMSNLSIKRQEMTIGQLNQFVNIMHSASPAGPVSRTTLAKLQSA
jgi:hypothetical protein